MSLKFNVKVTQEHIDRGRPGDYARCPIALALRDIEGVDNPDVVGNSIRFTKDGVNYYTWPAPRIAAEFQGNFDAAWTRYLAKPFEFELDVEKYDWDGNE